MSNENVFEPLDKGRHDRKSFDCGKPELNDFIQTKAVNHQKAGASRTLVLPADEPLSSGKLPIKAFFTVSATTMARASLPHTIAKKLPSYPVPLFLIAQLAVDKQYKGQGLGKGTLLRSMEVLWETHQMMPAVAIVVDCLDDDAQNFYLQYGFEELMEVNGRMRLFMSMTSVAKIFK